MKFTRVTPRVRLNFEPSYDPIKKIWVAFKTCYSTDFPEDLWKYGEPDMEYIERRLATGHTSPLEQASFQFFISDVSRIFTHQFVRHRAGVSVAQQSGRYTNPVANNEFRFCAPDDINGYHFLKSMETAVETYRLFIENGGYEEDARYLLPNCQATNLTVTMNLAAILHMADLRLCTLAQQEYREVMIGIKSEISHYYQDLGKFIQPKCGSHRQGFCDEDLKDYKGCVLRTQVSHVSELRVK